MSDSTNQPGEPNPQLAELNKREKNGCITQASGCIFAFLPIPMTYILAPGPYAFSEGPGGGGATMWLMLLTLPMGAIIFVVGSVIMSKARSSRGKYLNEK